MKPFNAYSAYYDLLYKTKDYRGESAYVQSLIQKHAPGSETILNLGCGTGSHDQLWLENQFKVTGVDQSETMLQAASTKNAEHVRNNCADYFQSSIQTLNTGKKYQVVLSLFHVFSYLTRNEDLEAGFATVAKHLDEKGIFIFDAWYGPCVLTERPEKREKHLENDQIKVTRLTEPTLHLNRNVVDVKFKIQIENKTATGNKTEEHTELHPMRYLFQPEVEALANRHGLKLVLAEEWMTHQPLSDHTFSSLFVMQK